MFGSTAEQIRRLDARGIPVEIVPGVSSFSAAAAALRCELTLPEVGQTVIITRAAGRTPMPAGESLDELGRHGATMVLFLSITLLDKAARELEPHYGAACPVAVVHRASWPDQRIVRGALHDIAAKVRAEKIRSQSIVIVGEILTCDDFADSRLYAADFSHRHRRGRRRSEVGP